MKLRHPGIELYGQIQCQNAPSSAECHIKENKAPQYVIGGTLNYDIHIETVDALTRRLIRRFRKRLHEHPNTQTLQLLEELPVRRLMELRQLDYDQFLICCLATVL